MFWSRWHIGFSLLLLLADSTFTIPVDNNATSLFDLESTHGSLARSAIPAPPHFVAYSDLWLGTPVPPPISSLKGFNVYNLAFLLLEGAWDNAQAWTSLTDTQRSSVKAQYAAAGIKIVISAFGSTDTPTTSGADPIATANTFADWVIRYQVDGIDVDYEDFGSFNKGDGSAETWLIRFTQQLRARLPVGQYILTHAPVAPWFEPNRWGGGGYLRVHNTVGNLIDWYNIQFYNQGPSEYIYCHSLLWGSSNVWPNTAVFQIAGNGVPLSKIVIGKPATTADADSGFMTVWKLAWCLGVAKNAGWNAGVMVWEYPHADANWIATVRSQSWPV
ncbi:glycoside hydrolase family 18 protein [Amanita muscaria Koide BX008]|uniref:Glycoside hydrolase family 18 protein n=1 Tax=Amanita muscaria (strain Koide BX008) TaxID=946122 RepID=A0A0C2W6J1_AMAMK|nr:glycoside hydrolase family 18 protein [Amanita muscaria Koide BX008]